MFPEWMLPCNRNLFLKPPILKIWQFVTVNLWWELSHVVYSAASHQSWLLWMPEKTACLKTQDCSEDYGLNPSCDIVEPWGTSVATTGKVSL